ncbi:MAG: hypothetical protein KBD78_00175 [Oligoflexales bacterium]|nr:hypothetical protein [Oligoflexales bacterium]
MQTDFEALCIEIFARTRGQILPGLERMNAALSAFEYAQRPHKPTVLIAGTNGKGSTAAFLWQMLAQAKFSCGLYTSPHIKSFAERFLCFPQACTNQELLNTANSIQEKLRENIWDELTFFEIATLLAIEIFYSKKLDVEVFEVGLGGRFDATNSLAPDISIVTSIGYDHQEYLGNDLLSIAKEKLGIARAGKPLFYGGGPIWGEPGFERFFELLEKTGSELHIYGRDFWLKNGECQFKDGDTLKLSKQAESLPRFLQQNYCVALAAFREFSLSRKRQENKAHKSYTNEMENAALEAIKNKNLPRPPSLVGRFETRKFQTNRSKENYLLLLDVCHNISGIEVFLDAVKRLPHADDLKNTICFVSILREKAINEMLDQLRSFFNKIILFQINNQRTFSRDQLNAQHNDLKCFSDFGAAWQQQAKIEKQKPDVPWVICGSVMAIGETLVYFEKNGEFLT